MDGALPQYFHAISRRLSLRFFALAVMVFLAGFLWAVPAHEPSAPNKIAELAGHPVFAVLKDGRLAGFSLVQLGDQQVVQMQTSSDGARTWTEPQTVLSLSSEAGHWGGPEVLVDHNGEVHLILLNDANTGIFRGGEAQRRPNLSERHLDIWHAASTQGLTQWQQPTRIWQGYTGSLNSIIQLKNGRIVLPFSYRSKRSWAHRGEGADAFTYMGDYSSTVLYSDDDGATWTLSPDELKVVTPDIRGAYGAVEPVVIQLKDGRVWMLIRSQMGRFYESFSADGARWSPPQPTSIVSSDSPAGLTRLADGRIVLLWNECVRYPYAYGGRQVLHGAVSSDEGKTWRGYREVMRDPHRDEPPPTGGDFGTAYPFPITLPDGNILFTSGQGGGRRASYLLDPAWLSETAQSTQFANGIDDWSTYGTKGVELIKTPSSEAELRIARVDESWPAAAVWNFPGGPIGEVILHFRLQPGFHSLNLGLTDEYSTPFDDADQFYNVFNLPISLASHLLDGPVLEATHLYNLRITWNTNLDQCRVFLDGRQIGTLKQTRSTVGLNYLRLRATAAEPDTGGIELTSISADVSASWPKSASAVELRSQAAGER